MPDPAKSSLGSAGTVTTYSGKVPGPLTSFHINSGPSGSHQTSQIQIACFCQDFAEDAPNHVRSQRLTQGPPNDFLRSDMQYFEILLAVFIFSVIKIFTSDLFYRRNACFLHCLKIIAAFRWLVLIAKNYFFDEKT